MRIVDNHSSFADLGPSEEAGLLRIVDGPTRVTAEIDLIDGFAGHTPGLQVARPSFMGCGPMGLGDCFWDPRNTLYTNSLYRILLGDQNDNALGGPNEGGSNKVLFVWCTEKP